MTTMKQMAANKANSQFAGVKTEEGKLRVRFNSYKHGIASKILISNMEKLSESEEALSLICDSLRESLKPRNSLEEELVHKMALSILKSERCEMLEKGTFSEGLTLLEGDLFIESPSNLELAIKYKGSVESSFYRALDCLMKLRQAQQMDLFWKGSHE